MMSSKAETSLYRAISSAVANAMAGNQPEAFSINIPFDEAVPGDESGLMLKVSVLFDWTSFEESYFDDINEEITKEGKS